MSDRNPHQPKPHFKYSVNIFGGKKPQKKRITRKPRIYIPSEDATIELVAGAILKRYANKKDFDLQIVDDACTVKFGVSGDSCDISCSGATIMYGVTPQGVIKGFNSRTGKSFTLANGYLSQTPVVSHD